jgi:hypothetical protein
VCLFQLPIEWHVPRLGDGEHERNEIEHAASARTRMRTCGQRLRMLVTMRATSSMAPSAASRLAESAERVFVAKEFSLIRRPDAFLCVRYVG